MGAQDDISHALSLSSRDPATNRRRAILHATLGRYQDAFAELHPVLEVDPLSAMNWRWLARFHMAEGRIAEARVALERSLASAPSSTESWYEMGWLSLMAHNPEDALASAKRNEASGVLAITALAEHDLGHVEAARSALEALKDRHAETVSFTIAETYAWLGERDAAFRWLERSYEQQEAGLFMVRMRPSMHRLRGDPRWHAFLRKMNLPVD